MAVMPVGLDRRSLACAERAWCEGDTLHCRNQLYGKEFVYMFERANGKQKKQEYFELCAFVSFRVIHYFEFCTSLIPIQCSFQTFFMLTLAPSFLWCRSLKSVRPTILWFGANSCRGCSVSQNYGKPYTVRYLFTSKFFFLFDANDFAFPDVVHCNALFWKGDVCSRDDTKFPFFTQVMWHAKVKWDKWRHIKAVHCRFVLFNILL